MTKKNLSKTLVDFCSEFSKELAHGGQWQICYHDSRHLQKDAFVSLGDVSFEFNSLFYDKLSEIGSDSTVPFVFRWKNISDLGRDWNNNRKRKPKDQPNNNIQLADEQEKGKTILGQLWESFFRLGMKGFDFEPSDLEKLRASEFTILVLDTSALRLGLGSFFVDLFQQQPISKSIWCIIPVQAILEIEDSIEYLKSSKSDSQIETLRKRPQATLAPLEINRLKRKHIPVEFLQVDPILLRKETLGDRVILESIKDLKRERGIERNIFLITSDRYLAQLARLENIYAVSVNIPHFEPGYYDTTDCNIFSLRYDIERQDFVGCSFPHFVWDLAHTFGTIRMNNTDTGRVYRLNYYFTLAEKGVNDWEEDRLEVVADGAGNT